MHMIFLTQLFRKRGRDHKQDGPDIATGFITSITCSEKAKLQGRGFVRGSCWVSWDMLLDHAQTSEQSLSLSLSKILSAYLSE